MKLNLKMPFCKHYHMLYGRPLMGFNARVTEHLWSKTANSAIMPLPTTKSDRFSDNFIGQWFWKTVFAQITLFKLNLRTI